MENYDYDVIIVGAGPAGSTAARYIKPDKNGLKVLMIDRRKEVDIPVQCGEGLSTSDEWKKLLPNYPVEELFKFPNYIIAQEVKYVDIISPYKTIYRFKTTGWTIYRNLFDQYLAELAIKEGTEFWLNTNVIGLKDIHTVVTSRGIVRGRIIVGADGAKSIIAKSSGLESPKNLTPAVISMVRGNFHDNMRRIYLGKKFAGGYAWIFSKGDTANVGIGSEWKTSLRKLLNNFIETDMGLEAKDIICRSGGIVPLGGPISKTVKENIMIVGDAAGVVFPSTGGGIGPALITGRECGITIENHFRKGTSLEEYENRWRRVLGKILEKSLSAKRTLQWITKHDVLMEIGMRLLGKRGIVKLWANLP